MILVKINGRRLSISEWARELGISRQRAHQLYKAGRLESYIDGERMKRGRPAREGIMEAVEESLNQPAKEVAEKLGLPLSSVYKYRSKICGK